MKNIIYRMAGVAAVCSMCLMLGVQDAQGSYVTSERKSGASMAGFSVLLERYYESLNRGVLPAEISEELNQAVGLTKSETGYISVLDIYENLGVANVEGYLNIREEPSESSQIVGKLNRHGGCEILEEENGWYKVSSGEVEGYVNASYLAVGDEAETIASQASTLTVRVDTEVLRIRTAPDTEAAIWDLGYYGEAYEVSKDLGDGWVELKLDGDDAESGGTTGYVYTPQNATLRYTLAQAVPYSAEHIEAQAHSAQRQKLVDYAMQFLGNPYVWGGTNPNTGADCSGFVQYVMKYGAGISLNRTSRDQGRQGTEIDSSALKPGDLIFYGNNKGSINHVALYIGDGQVIHSASKKTGVKISKWNYRNPVTIRNVLGTS